MNTLILMELMQLLGTGSWVAARYKQSKKLHDTATMQLAYTGSRSRCTLQALVDVDCMLHTARSGAC